MQRLVSCTGGRRRRWGGGWGATYSVQRTIREALGLENRDTTAPPPPTPPPASPRHHDLSNFFNSAHTHTHTRAHTHTRTHTHHISIPVDQNPRCCYSVQRDPSTPLPPTLQNNSDYSLSGFTAAALPPLCSHFSVQARSAVGRRRTRPSCPSLLLLQADTPHVRTWRNKMYYYYYSGPGRVEEPGLRGTNANPALEQPTPFQSDAWTFFVVCVCVCVCVYSASHPPSLVERSRLITRKLTPWSCSVASGSTGREEPQVDACRAATCYLPSGRVWRLSGSRVHCICSIVDHHRHYTVLDCLSSLANINIYT